MDYKRVLLAASLVVTFSNAQVSFLDFADVCDNTTSKSCPNNPKEIAIIQKLLNIGKSDKIAVSGKYDKATKDAIMALQASNNLPQTGYVGLQTKVALEQKFRELKYNAAHKKSVPATTAVTSTTKKDSSKKELALKTNKKSKVAKAKDTTTKKVSKKSLKKLADNKTKSKKIAAKKDSSKKIAKKSIKAKTFDEFRKYVNLRKSYRVFKDYSLLKKANPRNTTVKISVKTQRVNLLVNGKVALCAPCTTGAKHKLEPNTRTYRDKRTPYGTFKIMEKIPVKRSTIFGEIYVNGKVVYKGDRRKYRGPKGKFVGHPLKNWMRLTSSGIGLHASKYVKRYPGSNGCVRLPKDVSKIIFSKVSKGTKVIVTN
jgi:lipoprotein-anchoring transpeptidase ErfK/SrfK